MQSEARKTSSTGRLTGSRQVGSFHLPAIRHLGCGHFGDVLIDWKHGKLGAELGTREISIRIQRKS